MLTSLGSKLAILGPPRMIAEVPEALTTACELFSASGYVQEAVLTDYVLDPSTRTDVSGSLRAGPAGASGGPALSGAEGPALSERGSAARVEGFVIPVTVDDLAANGLLDAPDPPVCWERSVEALTARKDEIAGLAVASDERIEAYVLYLGDGEIVSLRTCVDDGGAGVKQLLSRLRAQGMETLRFPKVHPAEISKETLETLGFRPASGHLLYAAKARSN